MSSAAWVASVSRRGRSHTTVTPPRRPASTTASTGAGIQLVAAPGTGQDADPAMSRQRLAHRRPVQPSALQRQVGPPQPGCGLAAHQQIDAAAPRIEVHQERVGGGLRQCDREQRRAGPAATRRSRRRPHRAARRRAPIRRLRRVRGPVHVSCSGSLSTCWAPTVMAAAQVAVVGSAAVNTLTWARRGSAVCPHRSAAACIEHHGRGRRPRFPARPQILRRRGPPEHRRPRPPGPARRARSGVGQHRQHTRGTRHCLRASSRQSLAHRAGP